MDLQRRIVYWSKHLIGNRRSIKVRLLAQWIILFSVIISCESDPYGSHWLNQENLTICQYLEKNKEEYSKSYRLLVEGKMLSPLCGYNPHGEDYTLFLPTDEAIDQFVEQNPDYNNFEEMLLDTGFINMLTRYHTLNRKVHTDEFPDGALLDKTLSGDRLITGFYTDGDNQLIKVNNTAPIIKSNQEMTNGYIHIISEVLHKAEIPGYNWLQQQDDYSILARVMVLSSIGLRLPWKKYTILAEPDSVFHRIGIMNIEDLVNRIAPPGVSYSYKNNAIYKFAAYHIIYNEYYLNDFSWGHQGYWTLSSDPITIDVGFDIRINSGVETFGITISESGDTTVIDYIRPLWESSNIVTNTGPIHSISNVLSLEPFPK